MSISIKYKLSFLRAKLLTLTGIQMRGFFIHYQYASSLPKKIVQYPDIRTQFEKKQRAIDEFIATMASHIERFRAFGKEPCDPVWDSGMFPALDGAAAYTIIRSFKPRKIIEVGSGDSTFFLSRAARDCSVDPEITCIDPEPRRSIRNLNVKAVPRVLNDTDVDLCARLKKNDILFIDSSHIMLPGMDVDILFNRIFPRLARGVIVHLHDIFLPYDYPPHWRQRRYSEQNALVGWILSGYFDVIYPGHYAAVCHQEEMDRLFASYPPFEDRRAGSIWLRRK